jgi:hypothetical protein
MTGASHPNDDIGDPPCAGCPHVATCKIGFCCERFRAWSKTGAVDMAMPRVPRRAIYKAMFPADAAPMVDALLLAARKPQRVAA